ncbi:MAG: lamin tail domain-containing protein [Candidatus Falkowbacteria bacterium]
MLKQKTKNLLVLMLLVLGFFFLQITLAAELININTATLEELVNAELYRITPTIAQRIIDNRPFSKIEEITKVLGIGDVTFNKIKDLITVGGVDIELPPPPPPSDEAGQASNETEQAAPPLLDAEPVAVPVAYSRDIIINELMINPEDSDADNEYAELYNKSSSEVDISGWIITDAQGSLKKYIIPAGTKIVGNGYVVFYSTETRLVFNNSGDGAKLFWPGEILADETPENSGPAKDDMSYSRDNETWFWTISPTPGEENNIMSETDQTFLVTKVIDGDTIELETGEKIRYIGIDTPETKHPTKGIECFGQEAYEQNKQLVLNKKVRLEKDVTDKDSYKRLLRYVYVDDLFINKELVAQGYAYSYPYPPDTKYQNEFNDAEENAKNNKSGLWQKCIQAENDRPVLEVEEVYSNKIIINEILPNPTGSDEADEWVELKNTGDEEVDVNGWKISDATAKIYMIKTDDFLTTIIPAQGYFLIKREVSNIALNNSSGDLVELFWPNEELADQVEYSGKAEEEMSFARDEDHANKSEASEAMWSWTTIPTPEEKNEIVYNNKSPQAIINCVKQVVVGDEVLFDASDSVDLEGDKLNYFWQINLATTTIATSTEISFDFVFAKIGNYEINLTVVDSENASSSALEKIKVSSVNFSIAGDTVNQNYNIYITEVFPNPAGADGELEFIEIYNADEIAVNLNGWKLDDAEGGSRPYIIGEDVFIDAGQYLEFMRTETNLALNNTYDSARLFNDFNELIFEINFDEIIEDASYAFNDGQWQWTNEVTPGMENIISIKQQSTSAKATAGQSKKYAPVVQTTLEKIREFEPGDKVKVNGTVAVLPGVFSTQYFYIVGSPGVQVYSSKKLFPDLQIGDQVEVSGELSETYGELRLKTSTAEDIQKIATSTPPEPTITECDKIGENMEAQLVRVKGEVTDKQGSTVWLDDGSGEIEVYIKTSAKINKAKIKEGETITVIGIVSQKDDVYRVMPRSDKDIIIEGVNREGEVLGEISYSDEWVLAQNNKKLKLMQYLLIIAGGLIVVLGGVIWREKREVRSKKI